MECHSHCTKVQESTSVKINNKIPISNEYYMYIGMLKIVFLISIIRAYSTATE